MSPFFTTFVFSVFLFYYFCFVSSERAIVNSAVLPLKQLYQNRQMFPEMAIVIVFVFSESETSVFFVEKKEQVLCNHFFKTKKLRDYRALVNWLFNHLLLSLSFAHGEILYGLYIAVFGKMALCMARLLFHAHSGPDYKYLLRVWFTHKNWCTCKLTKQNPTPPLTRDVCSSTPS